MAAAGFYREDLNRIPLVLGVSQFIQVVSFSCLDVVIVYSVIACLCLGFTLEYQQLLSL